MTSATALRLIVIGASTGGVQALRTVISGLPADLGAAVLVALSERWNTVWKVYAAKHRAQFHLAA